MRWFPKVIGKGWGCPGGVVARSVEGCVFIRRTSSEHRNDGAFWFTRRGRCVFKMSISRFFCHSLARMHERGRQKEQGSRAVHGPRSTAHAGRLHMAHGQLRHRSRTFPQGLELRECGARWPFPRTADQLAWIWCSFEYKNARVPSHPSIASPGFIRLPGPSRPLHTSPRVSAQVDSPAGGPS